MAQDHVESVYQSTDLDVVQMVDPETIKLYRDSMADQINQSRARTPPPKQALDLSDNIADIIIETSAQGSSLLEVHVIDPAWMLLRRDSAGTSFIDVDEHGYLWPPIEVNFPPKVSDAVWRLCQVRASTDLNDANLVMTFEDRITAELREYSGPVISRANETRAEFIRRLVRDVRLGHTEPAVSVDGIEKTPVAHGPADGSVRFVPLLKIGSPQAFTPDDLASMQAHVPASAQQPNPPGGRSNPNKHAGAPRPGNLFPPSTNIAPTNQPGGVDIPGITILLNPQTPTPGPNTSGGPAGGSAPEG